MVDVLCAQVLFIISRELAFIYRRHPSAKASGPIGAAHSALRHPYNTTGKYYQKNHYENKPCVTAIGSEGRHIAGKGKLEVYWLWAN
jgi:hypothetical protein